MRLLFILISLLFFQHLLAQGPEKALEQLYKHYPQEKVVISFSKPEYLAGEKIFFKAYVLNGYELSTISTNLYTEFYDKNKNLLDSQIVPLFSGTGDGSFALEASMAEDVYYIRAYTKWMLNFDEAFLCVKPIRIYNPHSSQILRRKPVQWTAKAFAEGGNLLEDAVANISVRLYSHGSLPQKWSGQVLEKESNTAIQDLVVHNSEIGQARFIPEANKSYKLLLKDNLGHVEEADLPAVKKSGIVLQLAPLSDDKMRYSILFKGLPSAGIGYRLIASMYEQPIFMATITKSLGEVTGVIDIKDLPAGVLQLTLFDEKENPVASRLSFLHQKTLNRFEPEISTDTLSFGPKGYNHWQFNSDTLHWETYVVEVTDASLPHNNDLISAVYLTSDFTTPIRQANWYFEDVTDTKKAALDALLITENWNRFQWSEILQNRFPSIRFMPDKYLTFEGTVLKSKKPQPLREINMFLQAADSSTGFLQVKTDSAGKFLLADAFFTDTVRVYYQPNKQKFLESEITISFKSQNRFSPFNGVFPADEWMADKRMKEDSIPIAIRKAASQRANELLMNEKAKVMEEVVVKTRARSATEQLDNQLSSSLFSGGDANIFDFVNQDQTAAMGYSNILEWLQGRLPGYQIGYENGVAIPTIRGSAAQVFVDEMRVEYDYISSIPASNIAMIKVFRNNFLGSTGGGSAIAIYLRKGGMPSGDRTPTLFTNVIAGYKKFLPLSSPDYSVSANLQVKDERILLFRNTLLKPDPKTAKASIRFYNNDSAKQYRLFMTGFTSEGKPVFVNRIIQ